MTVGTYEKLSSGKVSARLPRSVDPKRRRLGTYGSKEEAKRVVNGSLALAQEGHLAVAEGQTLRGFLKSYLDVRELRGLRDTKNARGMAKGHIELAEFIDWPLRDIQRSHARNFLDTLQRKHSERSGKRLAASTVINVLNIVRACFDEALERNLVETNVFTGLRLHRAAFARTDDLWRFATPEQQEALLRATPDEHRPLIAFSMWTGIRKSETLRLRLADVHVDGPEPHVVVRYGRRGKPTKNGRVHRVDLFGGALDAAKQQLQTIKGKPNCKGVLFPSPQGEIRWDEPRGWKDWVENAGLPKQFRWHDLRHTAFTSLLSGWRGGHRWSMEEVQRFAGHIDAESTRRYAKLAVSALRETVAITEAKIRGPRVDQKAPQPSEIVQKMGPFLNRRSERS